CVYFFVLRAAGICGITPSTFLWLDCRPLCDGSLFYPSLVNGCIYVYSDAVKPSSSRPNTSANHEMDASSVYYFLPLVPSRVGVVLVNKQLVIHCSAMDHHS